MYRLLLRALLLLVLIGASGAAAIYGYRTFTQSRSEHALSLERIERIGRLELVRFSIKDVLKETIERPLFLPDANALLIAVGEVYAGIDLAKVRKEDIVYADAQVTVKLPRCEILSYRLDHQRTQVYDVSWGGFRTVPLVQQAYKSAEHAIREEAIRLGFAQPCKKQAVALLTPLFSELAKKKVVIEF